MEYGSVSQGAQYTQARSTQGVGRIHPARRYICLVEVMNVIREQARKACSMYMSRGDFVVRLPPFPRSFDRFL